MVNENRIGVIGAGTMGAGIAQVAVQGGFEAVVYDITQEVLDRDDSVDLLKDRVFHELIGVMCTDAAVTQPALELLLISRHLERIGDHATNIAEEAIFIVSGRDVRHHGREGGADAPSREEQ